MRRLLPFLLGLSAVALSGCVSGPRYERPAVAIPEAIRGQAAAPATPATLQTPPPSPIRPGGVFSTTTP